MFIVFELCSRMLFVLGMAYYVITLLQWYHYHLWRALTKHHKWRWHVWYVLLPVAVFIACFAWGVKEVFYALLYGVYVPMLVRWAWRLDKRLVWTARVWRFFGVVLLFVVINEAVFVGFDASKLYYLWLLPIVCGVVVCGIYEATLFRSFVSLAKDKLATMDAMQHFTIIMITASFGKTSMKHFLAQLLEGQYRLHFTPRSVNTLKGIVADINNDLDFGTEVYIVEAGARNEGDIRDITTLLHPHIGIIGEIGNAHIEYFRTIEATTRTKFELLESNRLQKVFIYEGNSMPSDASKHSCIITYPPALRDIETSLASTRFSMWIDEEWVAFETRVLGRFNIDNIAAAIMVAHYLGMTKEALQALVANLSPVPHRLNLSISHGKTIIDDGFNGNLQGMLEGIRLCSLYEGRKVIVTPGLIESDEESNIRLARAIDEVFDLAIITGERNSYVIARTLHRIQRVILKNKSQLENVLKGMVGSEDLVYFANDAPSYI